MGGKDKIKKKIVNLFPDNYENMIYIEPFVGGGSVFLEKEPSKIEVINDLDKNIANLYRGFKKYKFEDIKKSVDGHYTEEEFKRIRDNIPKNDFDKFIRIFFLMRKSYYNQMKSFQSKRPNINLGNRENIYDRMKKVKIFNTDYKNIIKKYNTENTLLYLDPPYEGSSKEHYENYNMDYNELKDILDDFKGKFLLSINDSSNIRKLFKDYNISTITTQYFDHKTNKNKDVKELIIKNY